MKSASSTHDDPIYLPPSNAKTASEPQSLRRKRTRAEFRQEITQNAKQQMTKPKQTPKQVRETKRSKTVARKTIGKQRDPSKNRQSHINEYFKQRYCKYNGCSQHSQDQEALVVCETCNDPYHWYCSQSFDQAPSQEDEFICRRCLQQMHETKKIRHNAEIEEFKSVPITSAKCGKCKSRVIDNEKHQCLKCSSIYHQKCFESLKDKMLCSLCLKELDLEDDKRIPGFKVPDLINNMPSSKQGSGYKPLKDLQLTSFFNQTKHSSSILELKEKGASISKIFGNIYSQDMVKKTQRKKSVSLTRKKNVLKVSKLIEDPLIELEVRESFKKAFFIKDLTYSCKQVYEHPDCPPSMNDPTREPSIQKLQKENCQSLNALRKREEMGILPPVLIKHDPLQGFYVEAAQDLPELTLLCEYAGEVRTFRQMLFDRNDSIMELLDTGDSDTSLSIAPVKYSNIGRFFNSINSSNKESRKKQNIQSMRCQVDGKVTVLIFTKKSVKKGENLLYDYNEAKDMYPTDKFV